jgi:hypothetical protein
MMKNQMMSHEGMNMGKIPGKLEQVLFFGLDLVHQQCNQSDPRILFFNTWHQKIDLIQ